MLLQVAPAELEAILIEHPGVADAAVVGIPDEISGELPLAFIVRKLDSTVSAVELEKFVAGTLCSFSIYLTAIAHYTYILLLGDDNFKLQLMTHFL